MKLFLTIFFILFALTEVQSEPNETYIDGITVDLRSPTFCEGVLSTTSGGVISVPGVRIQATNLIYSKIENQDSPFYTLKASGNVLIEYEDYVFVGEEIEYDFKSKTGVIYNGRVMTEPWYFGGEIIYLNADGSYLIEEAFITTSENADPEWQINSKTLELDDKNYLEAKNVKFKLFTIPIFWLPVFHTNLDSIYDDPVRYNLKWWGRQGHRFGLEYDLFSWNRFQALLRLDYRLKRGLGGGFEINYTSADHNTSFHGINYAARDSSIIHPGERFRYRFQGVGDSLLMDDKISIHLSYDKVSDIDMPTDYNDMGLELDTAGRTELLIRHAEDNWITNLVTHLRINNFQTVKEELPTFATSWRPFEIWNSGIVSDLKMNASYLDFSYGNNQVNVHDYCSTRLELAPLFYRHFTLNNFNITPEAGGLLVAYGNSPEGSPKWLTIGKTGCNINCQLWRHYDQVKHVITPYIDYAYYTMPTVSPGDHYIFDINDGWYRLNIMQFGVSQSFYMKENEGCINRRIYTDLYANAFIDNHTFSQTIPKVYANVRFNTLPNLNHSLNTGWDFIHNELDHYNVRTEWTYNANIAVAAEFRHRSPYDWRKADHTNFFLDTYRTIQQLEDSQVSDRRDTFLFSIFYRFHPSWAFHFESRSGWNRRSQPNYNEFEIDLIGTLSSAWNMKLSYQHREDDDRVSVYFSIGIKRPDCLSPCDLIPCLSF